MDIEGLAQRFRTFAQVEAKDSSPTYAALAERIANDPLVLEVAAEAPASQPLPNLLFAAVQYLLEDDPITDEEPAERAFARLQEVVTSRQQQVAHLLKTRLVQTNEVRRSIVIHSAIARACHDLPPGPIALIEIGASAGLNLLFDLYEFQYGHGPRFGKWGSPVFIRCSLRGDKTPCMSWPFSIIVSRLGIDLNPIDVHDEDQLQWLRALIWPEHDDRRLLLDLALDIRRDRPLDVIAGDGVELLPSILEKLPADVAPVVFHTFVANQLSSDSKKRLVETIDTFGVERDIAHVHNHLADGLHATTYRRGKRIEIPLAQMEGHARWVEWHDETLPESLAL